jgi:hypothetical protein
VDPGAAASDACAGSLGVTTNSAVNPNATGVYTIRYIASDPSGNSATNTRTVYVVDTTAPTILWSFTNLVLAADTNCSAAMPSVTGTNFILATGLSGALAISQIPASTAILSRGTNVVVITVADACGNAAYSTNTLVVQDQTPPLILSPPQSQTNLIGSTATFSVAATACTPLAFQWYFNNATLAAQTNSTLALSNLNTSTAGNYYVVATASGGSSTSIVAALTVNLLSDTTPLITGIVAPGDGSVTLSLGGAPSCSYILETTTNLISSATWRPAATNTLGTNGVWQFTETQATNFPQRFYRLKLAP